jgi:CheY-like chemotaxis protein
MDTAVTAPPSTGFDLLCRQVQAIDAWHRRRRIEEQGERWLDVRRQSRVDRNRRGNVLRREHQAILERTDLHLRRSGEPLRAHGPRAVVVHRHPWVADGLTDALNQRGVDVVATLSNGADAVGAVVVEQPELLVLSEVLSMLSGLEVVREARALSPATVSVVLVEHSYAAAELTAAGAQLTLRHGTRACAAADEIAGAAR